MKIHLRDDLPFITAKLAHQGIEIKLEKVILDTGSAATIFSTDKVAAIGLKPEKEDVIPAR